MRRKIALAPEVLEAVRGRVARHPHPVPPRETALGYTPFDVEMGRLLALGLLAHLAEQVAPLFPERTNGRELSLPATGTGAIQPDPKAIIAPTVPVKHVKAHNGRPA
jgi:hypothetical protein